MCTLGRICVRSPLPSFVTMIEVPVSATRKLAPVIPTSRRQELVAQDRPRLRQQLHGLREVAARRQMLVGSAEIRLDLLAIEMHGRRDDMRRRFAAKLNDIFAEVGLDCVDIRRLERGVEADLLGDHRLALGHCLGGALAAEL